MKKASFLDAHVVKILDHPKQQWNYHRRKTMGSKRFAGLQDQVDWSLFNPKDYLFTHDTIVASVKVAKDGYTIVDPCYELVNANGNAWSNQVLSHAFRTFIGKPNFYQHYQIQGFEKGLILDAVLRPVTYVGSNGKKAQIFYVDILVATNRKHKDIVKRIVDGQLTTMSMGCLKQNGLITMADGTYKKIIDIQQGDSVLTHNNISQKVTKLFDFDAVEVPLYKIYANSLDQQLQLTGEHPVYIVKAQDIKCTRTKRPCKINKHQRFCYYRQNSSCVNKRGQKYNCGRDKQTYQYPLSFVNVSQLKVGDYLVKAYPTNIVDDDQWSKQLCRIFGLYMGDGYLHWNYKRGTSEKRNVNAVHFCFNSNQLYLYEQIVQLVNKIDPQIKVKKTVDEQLHKMTVVIYSRKIAQLFLQNGSQNSHHKAFSQKIMLLPQDKQLQIIGGMFDTDGCYYAKTKQMSWSTASKQLFNQLHLMLLRNHIPNLQHSIFRKPGKNGKLDGKRNHWQYSIQVSKGSSGLIPAIKNLNYGSQQIDNSQLSFFYKNYYLCPIKKIQQQSYTGKVYNFSVQNDQSYLHNNMVVHNCSCAYVQCSYCGKIFKDDQQQCQHLQRHIGQFLDRNGEKVMVSQLIGALDKDGNYIQGSCQFIQASWVQNPAFEGAVLNYFLYEDDIKKNAQASKIASQKWVLQDLFSDNRIAKLRVADKYSGIAVQLMRMQKDQQKFLQIAKSVYNKGE